jgi:Protein of unknown function (DUF1214)/Transposase IS116/IS110/IS902 family
VLYRRAAISFFPNPAYEISMRVHFLYYATGITPRWQCSSSASARNMLPQPRTPRASPLEGGKTYKIYLPLNIPAKDFWSFEDNQTRSMPQTDQQFPSIGNQKKGIVVNPDTSVDVWFCPTASKGHEANWMQTVLDKGWNVLLRFYGDVSRFRSIEQAISYCGLCGDEQSSADKAMRMPLSKHRNKHIQRALVEAAKLAPSRVTN